MTREGPDGQGRGPELLYRALLLAYATYTAAFLAQASFVVDGQRYFSLFDDAMVSMQYAKNLAHGEGLVWNVGAPPVEGFSNPLWVLYMTAWHLPPFDLGSLSLAIQLSGFALCLGCLTLVRRIAVALSGGDPLVWLPAVALTATYLPFHFWALRGMETSLVAWLMLFATDRLCGEEVPRTPGWPFYLALGAGLLTRMDFAVPYAGFVLYLLVRRPREWPRTLFCAVAVLLVAQGGLTLFRRAYFGEWLPNTYYLKLWAIPWRPRVEHGALMALTFVRDMSVVVFALPFVYPILRPKVRPVWLLAGTFMLQMLYSIYVGGDAWDWMQWGPAANRFMVVAMPMFFILTALGLREIVEQLGRLVGRPGAGWRAGALAVALALVVVHLHGGSHSVLLRDLLHARGLYVAADEAQVRYALRLEEVTRPGATIAVAWAGAIPYFSNRPAVDLLGKNDPRIARVRPALRSHREVEPGHNKVDFAYAIGELQPDIVAHSYGVEDDPYLRESYLTYTITDRRIASGYNPECYLRRDSLRIRWNVVRRARWLSPAGPAAP